MDNGLLSYTPKTISREQVIAEGRGDALQDPFFVPWEPGGLLGAGKAAATGLLGIPFLGMVKKQTVEIPTVEALFESLGIAKKKVMADVDKLHRKHPDVFSSADDAENHVKYVLGEMPDHILPASDPRYTLLVRDASGMPVSNGDPFRGATVNFSGQKQNYWVRNATPLSDLNVSAKKTKSGK